MRTVVFPSNPNLEHLKKQAKDFLSLYRSGDSQLCYRIRNRLPRCEDLSLREILSSGITLHDAQHIIAQEYGFENWSSMREVVCEEPDSLVFPGSGTPVLTETDIRAFQDRGYIRIPGAFPREKALGMQDFMWAELERRHGIERNNRSTWPVKSADRRWPQQYGLNRSKDYPIYEDIASTRLKQAMYDIVGPRSWYKKSWGGFLITFPHAPNKPWTVTSGEWHPETGPRTDLRIWRPPIRPGLHVLLRSRATGRGHPRRRGIASPDRPLPEQLARRPSKEKAPLHAIRQITPVAIRTHGKDTPPRRPNTQIPGRGRCHRWRERARRGIDRAARRRHHMAPWIASRQEPESQRVATVYARRMSRVDSAHPVQMAVSSAGGRMIQNYIIVALRSLAHYRGYALINFLGLGIGMACCVVAGLYVEYELGYDRQFGDHTYRVLRELRSGESQVFGTTTSGPLAETMENEIPGVESAIRFRSAGAWMKVGEDAVEGSFATADVDALSFFNITMLAGDRASALNKPWSLVITQTMATQLFGQQQPIGCTITVETPYFLGDYTVTGVIPDFERSSVHFSAVTGLVDQQPFNRLHVNRWRRVA